MYKITKERIVELAVGVLRKTEAPLPLKEAAWRVVAFVVRCGRSNPISFVLRPVFTHKKLRIGVGVGILLTTGMISVFRPFPSLAQNTGGRLELNILSEGEVILTTDEAVLIPVSQYSLSQGYWLLHPGIDMAAKTGEPIRPVMAGVVTQVNDDRFGYGKHVIISHGAEYETLYAHMSKIYAQVGDRVNTESVIGEVGSTGRSTGPHLHLEIRENGRPINPKVILGMK